MIPGDPQKRAQQNHTPIETSVCESGNLLKTAPEGNGIVTLKSTDMRWRRKLVSRGSPEMVVRRLPISLKKKKK